MIDFIKQFYTQRRNVLLEKSCFKFIPPPPEVEIQQVLLYDLECYYI